MADKSQSSLEDQKKMEEIADRFYISKKHARTASIAYIQGASFFRAIVTSGNEDEVKKGKDFPQEEDKGLIKKLK